MKPERTRTGYISEWSPHWRAVRDALARLKVGASIRITLYGDGSRGLRRVQTNMRVHLWRWTRDTRRRDPDLHGRDFSRTWERDPSRSNALSVTITRTV
jgi:hypothetical protein